MVLLKKRGKYTPFPAQSRRPAPAISKAKSLYLQFSGVVLMNGLLFGKELIGHLKLKVPDRIRESNNNKS